MNKKEIAKMLDQSFLKPNMTTKELAAGCIEAVTLDVASVCILPFFVPDCKYILRGSNVKTCTVVSFPHGNIDKSTKTRELYDAVRNGAEEVDVVVNVNRVVGCQWGYVYGEIKELTMCAHDEGAKIKVIFETCYLNDYQIIGLTEYCSEIGVDWIKTSTGFGSGGATPEAVKLMMKHKSDKVQVKASGGIRDLATVLMYKELGVTRIGTSSAVNILKEFDGLDVVNSSGNY